MWFVWFMRQGSAPVPVQPFRILAPGFTSLQRYGETPRAFPLEYFGGPPSSTTVAIVGPMSSGMEPVGNPISEIVPVRGEE